MTDNLTLEERTMKWRREHPAEYAALIAGKKIDPKRARNAMERKEVRELTYETIRKMHAKGWSTYRIGVHMRMTHQAASYYLRKMGLLVLRHRTQNVLKEFNSTP